MKRVLMMGALLGAVIVGGAATSQAYPLRRPIARAVLPPYGRGVYVGPRVYGPRPYYRPYYGYRAWGPAAYGPGFYGPVGPALGVGIGIY